MFSRILLWSCAILGFCLLEFFFFLIYLFLAVLGLRFCARASPSCGERGPLFIAVRGPPIIVASLVAEHRLQMRRLSNCGSRAQPLRGMRDPPRPGLKPASPALAGRVSTTVPPGKPLFAGIFKITDLFHYWWLVCSYYLFLPDSVLKILVL